MLLLNGRTPLVDLYTYSFDFSIVNFDLAFVYMMKYFENRQLTKTNL